MSFDPIANGWRKHLKSGAIGYTETVTVESYILPQMSFTTMDAGGTFVAEIDAFSYSVLAEIPANEQVTVMFDGKAYLKDVFKVEAGGLFALFVGNAKFLGMEDSGEPFLWSANPTLCDAVMCDTNGDHTIAVYTETETETIVPIDPKYLPPVDSITMNGADGKQYKLTVNNGAISVVEVV